MNIKNSRKNNGAKTIVHLNVEKPSSSDYKKYDINNMDTFLKTKSKQFQTEDGHILANFGIDIDNPISLEYHYKKTKNFSDFIQSLKSFITATGNILTDGDERKLKIMYEDHVKKLLGKSDTVAQKIVDILIK